MTRAADSAVVHIQVVSNGHGDFVLRRMPARLQHFAREVERFVLGRPAAAAARTARAPSASPTCARSRAPSAASATGHLLRDDVVRHRVSSVAVLRTPRGRRDANVAAPVAVVYMKLAVVRPREEVVAVAAHGALEFVKNAIAVVQIAQPRSQVLVDLQ